MSRRVAAVQRLPGEPVTYQCVRVEEQWHATQEQALPPHIHSGGAWTICCLWATFTRGYEKRRPTCVECLRACERDEGIYVEPPIAPAATSPTPKHADEKKVLRDGFRQRATAAGDPGAGPVLTPISDATVLQAQRDANAAAEADFTARLNAVVERTKGKR